MSTSLGSLFFLLSLLPSFLPRSSSSLLQNPSNKKKTAVIKPGLVILKGILPLETQIKLANIAFEYGYKEGRFYEPKTTSTTTTTTQTNTDGSGGGGVLNNARQGRGRIYDSLDSYPSSAYMRELAHQIICEARRHDGEMPNLDPTHLLTMYYTTGRHLGWHSDNGANDGVSLQPVLSISLGNTALFLVEDEDVKRGEHGRIKELVLESGDVVVFGGPSRWIKHSVSKIYGKTAPKELCELMRGYHERYNVDGCMVLPESYRINFTFRNAPELYGKEGGDKFYYFARSARKFAEESQRLGVDEARRQVTEKRRRKEEEKRVKRERKAAKNAAAAAAAGAAAGAAEGEGDGVT